MLFLFVSVTYETTFAKQLGGKFRGESLSCHANGGRGPPKAYRDKKCRFLIEM